MSSAYVQTSRKTLQDLRFKLACLHNIFHARFDDTDQSSREEVTQNPNWPKQIAESETMPGEDAVLLPIKIHPPTLSETKDEIMVKFRQFL